MVQERSLLLRLSLVVLGTGTLVFGAIALVAPNYAFTQLGVSDLNDASLFQGSFSGRRYGAMGGRTCSGWETPEQRKGVGGAGSHERGRGDHCPGIFCREGDDHLPRSVAVDGGIRDRRDWNSRIWTPGASSSGRYSRHGAQSGVDDRSRFVSRET